METTCAEIDFVCVCVLIYMARHIVGGDDGSERIDAVISQTLLEPRSIQSQTVEASTTRTNYFSFSF